MLSTRARPARTEARAQVLHRLGAGRGNVRGRRRHRGERRAPHPRRRRGPRRGRRTRRVAHRHVLGDLDHCRDVVQRTLGSGARQTSALESTRTTSSWSRRPVNPTASERRSRSTVAASREHVAIADEERVPVDLVLRSAASARRAWSTPSCGPITPTYASRCACRDA